jgi:hypothetical protein
MQENTFCSQTKFLLVELRSHEVGRHLNRDIYTYTVHCRRVPKRALHGRAGVDAMHGERLVCLRAGGGVRHGGARQGA